MKTPAMRWLSVCMLILVVASLLLAGCQGQLGLDLSLGDGQDGGGDAGQVFSNPVVLIILLVVILALALGRR